MQKVSFNPITGGHSKHTADKIYSIENKINGDEFQSYEQPVGGGDQFRSPSQITSDIYDYTKEILKQVPNANQNICNYLTGLVNIEQKTVKDLTHNTTGIPEEHKTTYKLYHYCVEKCRATSFDDFVFKTGLSYMRFLDSKSRDYLQQHVNEQLSSNYNTASDFKRLLENRLIMHLPKLNNEIDKAIDEYSQLAKNYVKWANIAPPTDGQQSDSQQSDKQHNGHKIELDNIGIINVIYPLSQILAGRVEKSVAETLRGIDLTLLRGRDPMAVREFIDRIKRDTNYFDSDSINTNSLQSELLRKQMRENDLLEIRNRQLQQEIINREAMRNISPPRVASPFTAAPIIRPAITKLNVPSSAPFRPRSVHLYGKIPTI